MMRFTNSYQCFFDMEIVGYEYQFSNDKYDANWLEVKISVSHQGKQWSAQESCLRTFELTVLRDWLLSISDSGDFSASITFTENEIAFKYVGGRFFVILDFNFHPSGSQYNYDDDEEYLFEVESPEEKLKTFIDELNQRIEQFPEKHVR